MKKKLKLYCANCDDVMEHRHVKGTTYRCTICETTRPRHMGSELTKWEIRTALAAKAKRGRGRPAALTQDQIDEARRIKHAMSYAEIAVRFGVTGTTVMNALKKGGV